MDPVVVSLLGMGVTALLAYIGARVGITEKLAKVEMKVDELSARVEKHNCVVERTAMLKVEVDDLTRRLEKLEG